MLDNRYAVSCSYSEEPEFVNLQLHMWELACIYFSELPKVAEPRVFLPHAAVVLTLAGTSVSQLLGQTHESITGKVPQPMQLLETITKRLVDSPTAPRKGCYLDILARYQSFVTERYDPIRHFGLPKHVRLNNITFPSTVRDMELLWDVWQVVADYWSDAYGSPLLLDHMTRPTHSI